MVKIQRENFKCLRLSKTLAYVEGLFLLNFTWLYDVSYFGGSGNSSFPHILSIFFLGLSFEKNIKCLKQVNVIATHQEE